MARRSLQVVTGSPPPPELDGESPAPDPPRATVDSSPPPSIGLIQERSLVPPPLNDFAAPEAQESWASARFSDEPPAAIARRPQRPRRAGPSGPWLWVAISIAVLLATALIVGYVVLS
jgi:hypothetical protein